MSVNQEIALQNSAALVAAERAAELKRHLLSEEASRFFIQNFFTLTFIVVGLSTLAMVQFAAPAFRTACYFGMAIPIISSFASFLVTEWAFEQQGAMFLLVALGSVVLRMFNLVLAFTVGLVLLKFNVFGLITGLLGAYFLFLVMEISYIHKKGSLIEKKQYIRSKF